MGVDEQVAMCAYLVATDDSEAVTAGTEVAIADGSLDNERHHRRAKHKARYHVLVSSYNYELYDNCDHSNDTHHNKSQSHTSLFQA